MHTTRMRRWLVWLVALLIAGALVPILPSRAESVPLRLSLRRRSGADLLGRVAGTFNMSIGTPEELSAVTYFVDGQVVGRSTSFPFTAPIDTGDFAEGEHELEAVARFADGSVATSNRLSIEFRSRNWLLAVRQSMFLYAALVLVLAVFGGLGVRRLLRIQPRLILLNR